MVDGGLIFWFLLIFNWFWWKWGFWCIPSSVFGLVQPCRAFFSEKIITFKKKHDFWYLFNNFPTIRSQYYNNLPIINHQSWNILKQFFNDFPTIFQPFSISNNMLKICWKFATKWQQFVNNLWKQAGAELCQAQRCLSGYKLGWNKNTFFKNWFHKN